MYQYLNDDVTALPTVLTELGPDGNIDYVRGLSLVSENVGSKEYFYQFDGLGSVTTMTNEAGAHQANYGYDPWGQPSNPPEPPIGLDALGTKNKYKFTGEAADPNDGLLFLRARYYDLSLGRFLSRDELPGINAIPRSRNRYQYALSNPLKFTDRSGLTSEPVGGLLSYRLHLPVHFPTYEYQKALLQPTQQEFVISPGTASYRFTNWVEPVQSFLDVACEIVSPKTASELFPYFGAAGAELTGIAATAATALGYVISSVGIVCEGYSAGQAAIH